ncbi:MAG TPA: carboxypeptidase-like regulatory domain-containing protein [Pseudomonadales bacterium]
MSRFRWIALSSISLLLLSGNALAQDTEPNDVCPGEHVGMPVLPFGQSGSLDSPPDVPDVDFYRFDLTPRAELVANLRGRSSGAGALEDPLLGRFDADCNLVDLDDDGGIGLNARLFFVVPDDGVVILAASSYADLEFTGNGFSAGSYQLGLADAPPRIESISGRLVDARDGMPVTGADPTFALVTLVRCEAGECDALADEVPDAQGRFTFNGAVLDLRVGQYLVAASAEGYQNGEQRVSDAFQVGAGEAFELGDLALQPNPLQITSIESCSPLPEEGGVCRFALEFRNRSNLPFSGRVWSLVEYATPTGEEYSFQVGRGSAHRPQPTYVWVEPEGSERVSFELEVPANWPALDPGGFACLSARIGRAPLAVTRGVATVSIGCLTSQAGRISLMPATERASSRKLPSGKAPAGGRWR